jgi:hypothetical protein
VHDRVRVRQQLGGEPGRRVRIGPEDLLQLPEIVTAAGGRGQRQQQPGTQRGCHVMPGTGHLVEPPGITGQRGGDAQTGRRHSPTVPWAGAQRHRDRRRLI